MRQSRYAQRKTIAPTETERSADLIGNHRDARGVGMRIMLEFISARAEVLEDLNYRDQLAFSSPAQSQFFVEFGQHHSIRSIVRVERNGRLQFALSQAARV